MPTKDIILYVLSDTHCGHKLGLLNPETVLFDESTGGNYSPTPTGFQSYLWELYLDGIEKLKDVAKNKDIVVIILGDITHGNKYPEQLISTRMADQISIAHQALKPIIKLKNLKAIRLVFGTGSHEFGEGSSMLILKSQIEQDNKQCSVEVITHGLINIQDNLIDYAHHGPGVGIREWLNGNEVRFYLKNILYIEQKRGNTPPKLILRGHVHGFAHESIYRIENDKLEKSSITILPSMCGMSEFAKQGGKSPSIISNGTIMYQISKNTISDPIPAIKIADIRIKESLE